MWASYVPRRYPQLRLHIGAEFVKKGMPSKASLNNPLDKAD
jgi:hypothetical protein